VTFAVVFDEKKYKVLFSISMFTFPPTATEYTLPVSNTCVRDI
jgi:hypothetical protein